MQLVESIRAYSFKLKCIPL